MRMRKLRKLLNNPFDGFLYLADKQLLNWIPSDIYISILFRAIMKKKLNLNNPKTFNEKLQWLKVNNKNEEYTKLVDKYSVREYITKIIGEEYLIPLIGVYDNFDEINFEELPNQFVMKCTHDSGGVIICKDKNKLDRNEAKLLINTSLSKNYYYALREYPYKNITPKIIIEKYMVDESGTELKDYKFFCFDGIPQFLYVASNRSVDTKFNFFDTDFQPLPFWQKYPPAEKEILKPIGYQEMLKLSEKLSKGFPHIRVDFYDINGKIYFGELTFFHFSGLVKFHPQKYDEILGDFLNLPPK